MATTLARTAPIPFAPIGLSDSVDGTLTQSGENGPLFGNMSSLENLIPDPSTRGIWRCRPAAVEIADFTGFTNPSTASCLYRFGRYIYGMIASDLTPGYDEPFCYDVVSDTYVAVTGVTPLNVPVSPAASGDWQPPHMELVGVNLVVTHQGFDGITNFFGWLDISDPAAPVWSAGNVTTSASGTPLPSVPVWCSQFYNRAYFLVNPVNDQPAAFFTDPLTLNMSDASHILTFGDNTPLTCSKGMSYNTQLNGGVVQFLLVFKGVSDIYQIQGDAASTDKPLQLDALNVSTGTLAPNSVVNTSKGLMFMSPDGYRVIDFTAKVSDPIGAYGQGITLPFIYAAVPSRVCAAYASGVMRVSLQNNAAVDAPMQEYWFHTALGVWSGPHSFPAAQIVPYDNTFIMVADGVPGKLWRSDAIASTSSVYEENGVQMAWSWSTVMLPDPGTMSEMSWNEMTLDMALVAGMPPITFRAFNQDNQTLDDGTTSYPVTGSVTVWGAFTWGAAVWGGTPNGLRPRLVSWDAPVVYRRVALEVAGESRSAVKIGKLSIRREELRYIQQDA